KAVHLFSMLTSDPEVEPIGKTAAQYVPTAFTTDDFKAKFKQINGQANGDRLASVVIATLPPAGQGSLYLNNTPVTAGQEIPITDIANLQFHPSSGGFTGTASFKWNGSDGEKIGLMDADVTLT